MSGGHEHTAFVSVEHMSLLPWEGLVKECLPSAQETSRAVFWAPFGCVLPRPPKAVSSWRGPSTCGGQHLGLGNPGLRPTQVLLAFCASAAGEAPARPLASSVLTPAPQAQGAPRWPLPALLTSPEP